MALYAASLFSKLDTVRVGKREVVVNGGGQ
jgi:hypothetical protein